MTTPKKSARQRQEGFTLVEVMVASFILVLSVLGTVGAFSYARRTVSRTENRLASLHIAREVMETLRAESYDSALLEIPAKKTVKRGLVSDVLTKYDKKRGYYEVTETISSNDGAKKEITVVIEWEEPADAMRTLSVSLTTFHSRGLHP